MTDWPPNPTIPRRPEVDEQREILITTGNPTEADYLERQLKSRGIACLIGPGETADQDPMDKSPLTFEVMVYSNDL
jgi:hypothetical protein